MQIDFYHLTRLPLERALPRIAERVIETGGRLLVVSADPAQRAKLDAALWTYSADSFLPHGEAGAGKDDLQPVLISGEAEAPNGARNIALVDGEWRDAALGFERAFHFFDEARIAEARAAWKALADKPEVERRYWKQNENGRWEQAA